MSKRLTTLVLGIINETGAIIGKSLKFTNSHSVADKLIAYIAKNIGSSEVIFGLKYKSHLKVYLGT